MSFTKELVEQARREAGPIVRAYEELQERNERTTQALIDDFVAQAIADPPEADSWEERKRILLARAEDFFSELPKQFEETILGFPHKGDFSVEVACRLGGLIGEPYEHRDGC